MKIHYPLPRKPHQEQFAAFVKVLAEKFKPLYIYCFGRIGDSSFSEGCFIERNAIENHKYHLLMVIESATRIEHEVQNYANDHFLHGSITILVHGKETITAAVKANNRFFISVANHGELLYSQDSTIKSFQVAEFIPTQAALKAKKHYDHRRLLAIGFLESAQECLRTGKYHLSVFMMHQVVEQCCIGLIRVHLAYRSDIHNLYRLLNLCDCFCPELSEVFLSNGNRLFDLMVKSYSAARYRDDFHVEQSDAEKLYNQVSAFLKLTAVMCEGKIKTLALEAEFYKQHVQKESEVQYG